jgi:hypothetical protein
VAIMDSGKILAQGSPEQVRILARSEGRAAPSMDDAFVAVVEQVGGVVRLAGVSPFTNPL